MKKAYALFKNNELMGCYFAKSKATRQVDEHLGTGLFSPKWEDNRKGEYEIVPCEVAYDKLYIVQKKGKKPKLYASLDVLIGMLKEGNVKINKKSVRPTTFTLNTSRGELKGKIVQVQ